MEEAPIILSEKPKFKKKIIKPNNSIELNLISDKNINYDVSIFYIEDKLYFQGTKKEQIENKTYEKIYSIEEVKSNKYFYMHENVKEVFEELNLIIRNCKNLNEIKLLEKENGLLIIFPLNTLKIKECIFELNEVILENDAKFDLIIKKLNEINEETNQLKKENEKLKEIIKKQNNNIQTGEYIASFPDGKHYMNTKKEYRSAEQHITFGKKYETKPNVMVSISSLDAGGGNSANVIRIKVYAKNIDTSGFDVEIQTWHTSTLFEVKVSWIAFSKNN
jgi:hypothetical protein